jgi:hypothetical protein
MSTAVITVIKFFERIKLATRYKYHRTNLISKFHKVG